MAAPARALTDLTFTSLGPQHRDHLRHFRCATTGNLPSIEVELAIQSNLAEALGSLPGFRAIGGWHGDNLASLASWEIDRPEPGRIWIGTLAVAREYQRDHVGLQTKEYVLELAAGENYTYAQSQVHVDNTPMIMLNEKLGADRRRRPRPNDEWFIFTIRLR